MRRSVLVLLALVLHAPGTEFHVAPTGASSGTGSAQQPWSLSYALSQPAAVRPGDTIWLHGGTYLGSYTSQLSGTLAAPIVVRQFPGERAVIDANNPAAIGAGFALDILGSCTWFRDFEVWSSQPSRVDSGEPNSPNGVVFGVSDHIKLIDLVIHDLPGQGVGFWSESTDSDVYGCLVYYNGIASRDHGIYAQNQTGTKRLWDNLVFKNAGYGLHLYASSAHLDNFDIEGNALFDNGAIRQPSPQLNQALDGGVDAQNTTWVSDYTYSTPSYAAGENVDFGYGSSIANLVVQDCVFVAGGNGAEFALVFSGTTPVAMTGNAVFGQLFPSGIAGQFPSNAYDASQPSGTWAYVRANQYEAGRGNVIVYNWSAAASVAVDIGQAGLAVGDAFEVRDAQAFFAAPILTGTYGGAAVPIPMTASTSAAPAGNIPTPLHTPRQFGAFVVRRTGGAVATPTISPNGGSFASATTVSLACATSGAAIRYTTDGSTPSAGSPLYAAPFTPPASATVKAIGLASGMTASAVASASFTIGAGGSGDVIWVEDAVPAGATQAGDGEGWTWIAANPPPFSGSLAHPSALVAGVHQHYFFNASQTLPIASGDVLVAYAYLDPANPPRELMLQWYTGSGDWSRAYWGADEIGWGADGTATRLFMGALPAAGQWVRLEVPASLLGLEGRVLNGMAFTLAGGRATWDHAGKRPANGSSSETLFADSFSGATLGPAWSLRGGAWSQADGALGQTSTAAGDPKKAIIGGSFPSDAEIVARVRVDAWNAGDYARAGVGICTDPTTGDGYNLVFHGSGQVQFLDDQVAWGNAYAFPWSVGTWYWFALKRESGVLYGKVWPDGAAEPSAWPYAQDGWTVRSGQPALNGGSAGSGAGSSTASFDDVTVSAVVPQAAN